ncbi:MAG: flavodoxin family protein, partial [Mailhella sp.]|nr:flavodoxin family protein [Mailhella sp.]
MKAVFVNGSPRKEWNTHQVLLSAAKGAESAGAETEIVHLADYSLKGCMSCFACKLKGAVTGGVCAWRDDLRPVMERVMEADVLVVGSPVYFGTLTAQTHAFLERLLFPVLNYMPEVDG